MSNLTDQKCTPCEGHQLPMTGEEVKVYLVKVPGWVSVDDQKIEKEFILRDFSEALSLANEIGRIAETENHHPDIFLHQYKKLKITLSTHAIGGLSKNDFILAAKINQLTG